MYKELHNITLASDTVNANTYYLYIMLSLFNFSVLITENISKKRERLKKRLNKHAGFKRLSHRCKKKK